MPPFIAFDGPRRIAAGVKLDVVRALRRAEASAAAGPLLAFDFETGTEVDFDLRGDEAELAARFGEDRAPGRPKLGVIAREVTLLPRHWEWLGQQRGGASAAIRRLVEAARRADQGTTEAARAREAAYRLISTLAGNLAHFEEASRALFADERDKFAELTTEWPRDIVAAAIARLDALSAAETL